MSTQSTVEQGYKALAAAVLMTAVRDLKRRDSGSRRECALAFFRPDGEMLRLYCAMLDLDPQATSTAAYRCGRNEHRRLKSGGFR